MTSDCIYLDEGYSYEDASARLEDDGTWEAAATNPYGVAKYVASVKYSGAYVSAVNDALASTMRMLSDVHVQRRSSGRWGVVHRNLAAGPWAIAINDPRLPEIYTFRHGADEVKARFERDRDAWLTKSMTMSSITDMAMLPEYQRIIGLGPDAVPLIIEELRKETNHWFWALVSIVGADHGTGAETLPEAAAKWIAWFDSLTADE